MSQKRTFQSISTNAVKKQRKSLTLELKLDILRRIKSGERQNDISKELNLAGSTIRTILKNKDKIEECGRVSAPLDTMKFSKTRDPIMLEMERLLIDWIEEWNRRGLPHTISQIQEKARNLFNSIKENSNSSGSYTFQASKGWFERFKKRTAKTNPSVFPNYDIDDADDTRTTEVTNDENPDYVTGFVEAIFAGNDSSSMSEASFITSLPFACEPTEVPPLQRVSSPTNSNTDLYNLQWSEFSNKFCGTFISLLESQEFVDVTIATDGGYVQAHKLVLSVSSDYFRDLFKINPCKHPIVILKDIDYHLMNNLIQFMYCGEVKVAADKLPALLNIAEMLKIKGLIKENEQLQMEATTSDSTSQEVEPPSSSNIKIPVFKKPTIQTETKQNDTKSMPSNIEITILQEESQSSKEKLTQTSPNVTLNTIRQYDTPPNKRTRYREPETIEENTINVRKKITEIETTETLTFKSENKNNEDSINNYAIQLIPNFIKKELECPNDYLDIYGNVQHDGVNIGRGYNYK